MKKNTTIVQINKNNYLAAADFLEDISNGVYSKKFWLDSFIHWWDKNPAMDSSINRGWMLYDDEKQVKGFIGNIPAKYFIKGKEVIVCSATSWYTADDARDSSLLLLNHFMRQYNPLLDTTPSERVVKILCRLGFCSLKQNWLEKHFFYPANITFFWDFYVNRLFSHKKIIFLLKILGIYLIPFMKIIQTIKEIILFWKKNKYSFKEIHKFDNSYKTLWDKFKLKHEILALRDDVTLNWFFFEGNNLNSSRRVIEIRDNETLIGYCAVKLGINILKGKEYFYYEVVDIVLIEQNPDIYLTIVKALLWLSRNSENNIIFIKINPLNNEMEKCFTKFGFLKKKRQSFFLYKNILTGSPGENDLHQHDFYATPLDGDRCYFP